MSKKIEVERILGYRRGEDEIEKMISGKKTFTSQVGKSSIILKFIDDLGEKRKVMYSDEFKSMKYLGFLAGLKSEIRSNAENIQKIPKYSNPSETKEYFRFSSKLNEFRSDIGKKYIIEEAYEVDATAAYYQSAKLLGYISEETYQKAVNVLPKSERLWLLGAIASHYVITEYKDGEIIGEPKPKEDELLRKAWKQICEHIDYVMMDVKNAIEDKFLFYWVDGIYFNGEGDTTEIFDRIRAVFWRHKIHFRVKPIERIELTTTSLGLNIKLFKGHEEKEFKISKRLLKEYNKDAFQELGEAESAAILADYMKMQQNNKFL